MSQERIGEKIFPEKRETWFSPPEEVEASHEQVTSFIQDRINKAERTARAHASLLVFMFGRGTEEIGDINAENPSIVVLEHDEAKGKVFVASVDDYFEALSKIMENLGVDFENPTHSYFGLLHHTTYSAKPAPDETVSFVKTTRRVPKDEGKAQEGTVTNVRWKVEYEVPGSKTSKR